MLVNGAPWITEIMSDSDDELEVLLRATTSANGTSPGTGAGTRGPKASTNTSTSTVAGAGDDLVLITPDPARHKLIQNHKLITQSLAQKSHSINTHEALMAELKASLTRELSDTGRVHPNVSRVVDRLLAESKDIDSYKRNFYILEYLDEGQGDQGDGQGEEEDGLVPEDLKLAGLGRITLDAPTITKALKSTNTYFLRKINSELSKQVKEAPPQNILPDYDLVQARESGDFYGSFSKEPVYNRPPITFPVESHHLGLISSQLRLPVVKLDHYNPRPEINLLRIQIVFKLMVVHRAPPELYPREPTVFDSLEPHLLRILCLTLCDANALRFCYSEVLELAKLFFSCDILFYYDEDFEAEEYSYVDPLDQYLKGEFEDLFTVGLYQERVQGLLQGLLQSNQWGRDPQEQLLDIIRAKYEDSLHCNALTLFHIVLSDPTHPKGSEMAQAIRSLTNQFMDYDDNSGLWLETVDELVQKDVDQIFHTRDDILEFYRVHYSLRLLPYVNFGSDYNELADAFADLKGKYHDLMGKVSFLGVEDPFKVKHEMVQMLNEDYNWMDFYCGKYGRMRERGDIFY